MGFPLSPLTVTAIARVICGTKWDESGEYCAIGLRRSADIIECFMQDCGVNDFWCDWNIGQEVRNALRKINNDQWLCESEVIITNIL
jgi:hypothetical protein